MNKIMDAIKKEKRLLFALICFVWTTNVSLAQPGSYTFCFGFTLYDQNNVITDTFNFHFLWAGNIGLRATDDNCHSNVYSNKNSISYRLPCHNRQYVLLIIKDQRDTMKLTFLHKTGMDQYFFIKKVPFQKGHYILSQGMFDYPYRLPDNFDLLKEKRDSTGNLLITDYWDWDKNILKEKILYTNDGNEIMSEYWWSNGNKMSLIDRIKNTQTFWYSNGQIELITTSDSYLRMDPNGTILKRTKLNPQTKQWEDY